MLDSEFDWTKTRALTVPQVLLAVFAPSAIAFFGFHRVLPHLVSARVPPLLAWIFVAGSMLALLVAFAWRLLLQDARQLHISLKARLCLIPVSARQWRLYLALAVLTSIATALVQRLLPSIWQSLHINIPDYFPFFLRGIDRDTTPVELLSPGLPLRGAYWLIPLVAVVLALNVLAEEFYFRAWLLPKMAWMGKASWIVNGLLFALYHTFQLWLLPILLMGSLTFAFIVWHSKSIIPSMVLHFLLNFLFSVLGIMALIMGLSG